MRRSIDLLDQACLTADNVDRQPYGLIGRQSRCTKLQCRNGGAVLGRTILQNNKTDSTCCDSA